MKRFIFFLLIVTGITAFSAAQTAGETFRQEGIASWYGREFDGRPTASGEIFNSDFYTAAHPTLPFGTLLVVTNRQNNRQVTVRINDRGPFVAARIIDLSRAAAEVLDMLVTGTAPVFLERTTNTVLGPVGGTASGAVTTAAPVVSGLTPAAVSSAPVNTQAVQPSVENSSSRTAIPPAPVAASSVPPATPPAPVAVLPAPTAIPPAPAAVPVPAYPEITARMIPQTAMPPEAAYSVPPAYIKGGIPAAVSDKKWRLQVGAYSVPRNAVDAFDKLKKAGLNPAYEKSSDLYRVVLAGLNAADIPRIAQILGNAGFREALIRAETGN